MDVELPILQFEDRPGVLDLGWGHPHPDLLPVTSWREAVQESLEVFGWRALTYGFAAGPGPLVEWLGEHLALTQKERTPASQFFVTNGASHALSLLATLYTRPGDLVMMDAPTYHYALRIFRDHGVTLVQAPVDDEGIDPAALDVLLGRLRQVGERVPLLYLVPTFANPTGKSLAEEHRRLLVEGAHRHGLTVIEDDTYRELAYDAAAPPALWSLDCSGPVVRVGTFSKTVAPGLRLGWINAAPHVVRRLVGLGYVDSGGGVNHSIALAMAVFGSSGRYRSHVERVRDRYAGQRDTLIAELRDAAPLLEFDRPEGGWFVWARLPSAVSTDGLLVSAHECGVSFTPGSVFFADPGNGAHHLRLAFSMLPPDQLAEAARRLGSALDRLTDASGCPADTGRPVRPRRAG
jgi:2-aminoadipate transaminase